MLNKGRLREKIKTAIVETKELVSELKELTKPIGPENAIGRISRMDAINNKSINDAALRKAVEKLRKLKFADEHLDDANFGICIKCKQEIPEGRLLLMPQATKCVNCS